MKDFEDFEKYVKENGNEIHDSIHSAVLESVEKESFDNELEEHEFYRRAWVEFGIMKFLKHYHKWLNG